MRVGIAMGTWAALPYLRQRGVGDEQVFQILTPCVVAALVGARLFYVLNHLGDFGSIGEVLALWEGGLSLLGGLVPAFLLAVVMLRRRRLPVLRLLDGDAPGLAVGIAVGRIGDLVVADHLGKPTRFVLGYVCPSAETASPAWPPLAVPSTSRPCTTKPVQR
jgi:prolipoprotein diacylglyceryltransferase